MLYTDGLIERRGEPLDEALDRLAAAAGGPHDERPSALCGRVLERLLPAGAAEDDVALLVARRGGAPAFALTLPAEAAELATLRAGLRAWLAEVGAEAEEVADIVLACDEAAANAVEHAYLAGTSRDMTVVGSVASDGLLRIEVRDRGRWRATPAPGDRGRGIPLMRALMDAAEVMPGAEGCAVRMSRRLRGNGGQAPPTAAAPVPTTASDPSHARLRDLTRRRGEGAPQASARLVGEVDHASVPELVRRLAEAVEAGDELTLDLTEVTFIDSAGVRMLVDLAGRLAPPAGRLRLIVHPASAPRRALGLSGVDGIPGVELVERT
jgi:anti-anti-sigma factor